MYISTGQEAGRQAGREGCREVGRGRAGGREGGREGGKEGRRDGARVKWALCLIYDGHVLGNRYCSQPGHIAHSKINEFIGNILSSTME